MLLCKHSPISYDIFDEIERKSTDTVFLALKGIFLLFLGLILAYCASNGDVNRIISGYDDCGYACGSKNVQHNRSYCKKYDKQDQKYLLIEKLAHENSTQSKNCVKNCEDFPGYVTVAYSYQCKNSKTPHKNPDVLTNITHDVITCWKAILITCVASICFSVFIAILIRCHPQVIIWLIIISVIIILIILSVTTWYFGFRTQTEKAKPKDKSKLQDKIVPAIVVTFLQLTYCISIFFLKRHIELAIMLIQDAINTIKNVSNLLLLPWLTTGTVTAVSLLWMYFALLIESSGTVTVTETGSVIYVKNLAILVARFCNTAGFVWFLHFIFGCQHLIVCGAVGKWYFTREKNQCTDSFVWSVKNLLRFHLGTATMGLLFLLPVKAVLGIVEGCKFALRSGYPQHAGSVKFLEYLSKNAYVTSAILGLPFYKAGREAFHIVLHNGIDLVSMKTISTMVMIGGKIWVVIITIIVGATTLKNNTNINNVEVLYVLEGAFAFLVMHCFLSVYQISIETIFICLCLDCERNDGLYRPYYMTPKLREFLKNARALERSNLENAVQ